MLRLRRSGKLLHVALEAGVAEARERLLGFSIDVPLSPEEFWTVRTEMSDKLRTKLADLARARVREIRHEFFEVVRPSDAPAA